VLGFFWDHKIKLLALAALLVAWSIFGDFRWPWQPSRDTLRAELKEARTENAVLAHERVLEKMGGELALNTERDAGRRADVLAEVEQELEDAVSQMDFDQLFDLYDGATERLWHEPEPEDRSDPAPGRSAPVHSARDLAT
jgi:hypothetical protein